MDYLSENEDSDFYKITFKNYRSLNFDLLKTIIDCDNFEKCENILKLDKKSPKYSLSELDDCSTKNHFKPYDEWQIFKPTNSIEGISILPGILKPEFRKEWFDYFYNVLPTENNLKANIDLTSGLKSGLRWITFGYHHDWNTKHYKLEQKSVMIPDRIKDLSRIVSNFLNLNSFKSEAGIVNYYNRKSSLYFHTDHSEIDQTAPLFSFSLGTPTIFLIGGLSKDSDTPIVPILLRDSDLLIMSGQSRLALHAVPRIFSPQEFEIFFENDDKTLNKKKKVKIDLGDKSFIYRININVRQVFPSKE